MARSTRLIFHIDLATRASESSLWHAASEPDMGQRGAALLKNFSELNAAQAAIRSLMIAYHVSNSKWLQPKLRTMERETIVPLKDSTDG
jgi:hypothetical protein